VLFDPVGQAVRQTPGEAIRRIFAPGLADDSPLTICEGNNV